jgi:3-hydroxyisobutyrate dehydrogenase-like beta-hydroxyacid dehydrogenase
MQVGFIGLGIMGTPMAMNILKDSHRLTIWNRTPDKARPLVEAGATAVASPAEIGNVDVLITCVADGVAEEEVIFGSGLIDRLPKASVHMASTTIGIATARRLTEAHGAHGRLFVAAPVLGRAVDMAAARKLFVLAAGPPEGLARCAPLFAAIGQRTFEFGAEPVTATAVKLAINFLIANAIEGMGEAFALTGQYGVRPADFYEFMTSTMFPAPPYRAYGKMMAQDNYLPANFIVPLGLKDMTLALEAAATARLALPAANVMREHLIQALAQGYEDEDWAVIARVIQNALTPRMDTSASPTTSLKGA